MILCSEIGHTANQNCHFIMFSEESSAIEANKPYEITGSLGTGGYAEVFRAKKVDTGEYFALKRIKRYRLNDPKMSRQVSF